MNWLISACLAVTVGLNLACAKSNRGTGAHADSRPAAAADIEAQVLDIVAKQMGVRRADISPRTSLSRDLKADDLDLVELVMEVEDHFAISVTDEEAMRWTTIGEMTDCARRLYGPPPRPAE